MPVQLLQSRGNGAEVDVSESGGLTVGVDEVDVSDGSACVQQGLCNGGLFDVHVEQVCQQLYGI